MRIFPSNFNPNVLFSIFALSSLFRWFNHCSSQQGWSANRGTYALECYKLIYKTVVMFQYQYVTPQQDEYTKN
jgi:hypothetical protein